MNSNQRVINSFNLQLFADVSEVDDFTEGLLGNEEQPEEVEEVTEETTEEADETETEELEVSEEVTEADEQTEEMVEAKEAEETLDDLEVKYLHETKKLKDIPKDELKTYVQKGMNYDRTLEKFTIANEKLERIATIAELHNMTVEQMTDSLLQNYATNKAEEEGLSKSQVMERVEQTQKASKQKMYDRFVNKYPDVKAEQIPQEVWDATKLGDDLTQAYTDYITQDTVRTKESELNNLKSKIAELEGKLKTKEQNETVKKKAVVKATSKNGVDNLKEDDFLQGLLGE